MGELLRLWFTGRSVSLRGHPRDGPRAEPPEEAPSAATRDEPLWLRRGASCPRRDRSEELPPNACLCVKPVRELDAGKPHVQFDEGVEETDCGCDSARAASESGPSHQAPTNPEQHRASTPPLPSQGPHRANGGGPFPSPGRAPCPARRQGYPETGGGEVSGRSITAV